jgi:serine/threonine-protein kinase
MPDVRGDRIDQAQAALAGAGFSNIRVRQESTNDPSELGRVLDQSPSPGKSVSTDDQITLTVGTPGGGSSSSETTSGN